MRNLDATQGLVFSGQLLQDLVEHGAPREDAYKWVQAHAMAAWESETSFQDRVAADANIRKFLDEKRSRTPSICSASCAPWTPSSSASSA